jgi:hypothetical protein
LLLIVDRFRFKSGAYASAECVCLRLAAARTLELHNIAERNKPEPNEEALFQANIRRSSFARELPFEEVGDVVENNQWTTLWWV